MCGILSYYLLTRFGLFAHWSCGPVWIWSSSGEQMSWIWPVSHILTFLVMGSSSIQPRARQDGGECFKSKLLCCIVRRFKRLNLRFVYVNMRLWSLNRGFYMRLLVSGKISWSSLLQDTEPLNKYDQLYKPSLL